MRRADHHGPPVWPQPTGERALANFTPIEPAWATVKSGLRRVEARSVDALDQALGPALGGITAEKAAGYFRHCGYVCLSQLAVCYSAADLRIS